MIYTVLRRTKQVPLLTLQTSWLIRNQARRKKSCEELIKGLWVVLGSNIDAVNVTLDSITL
jgi:hypothetical protein